MAINIYWRVVTSLSLSVRKPSLALKAPKNHDTSYPRPGDPLSYSKGVVSVWLGNINAKYRNFWYVCSLINRAHGYNIACEISTLQSRANDVVYQYSLESGDEEQEESSSISTPSTVVHMGTLHQTSSTSPTISSDNHHSSATYHKKENRLKLTSPVFLKPAPELTRKANNGWVRWKSLV